MPLPPTPVVKFEASSIDDRTVPGWVVLDVSVSLHPAAIGIISEPRTTDNRIRDCGM
jgi:hypothetical protein